MRLPCTKCLHHAACEGGAMYNQDVIMQSIIIPCLQIEGSFNEAQRRPCVQSSVTASFS